MEPYRLATASSDRTIRIWDAATGAERALLAGHQGAITGIAINPDGAWLASIDDRGTVNIWETFSGNIGATLRMDAVGLRVESRWNPDRGGRRNRFLSADFHWQTGLTHALRTRQCRYPEAASARSGRPHPNTRKPRRSPGQDQRPRSGTRTPRP
jgi:WD domain, G-beta repeat